MAVTDESAREYVVFCIAQGFIDSFDFARDGGFLKMTLAGSRIAGQREALELAREFVNFEKLSDGLPDNPEHRFIVGQCVHHARSVLGALGPILEAVTCDASS